MTSKRPVIVALLVVLAATACTARVREEAAPQRDPPAGRTASTPSVSPTPIARPHPVSLPALMQKRYDGRGLRLGRELARTDDYTRYFVSYQSGRLRISGIMNIPDGRGPFPVLVLNHGYIDPAIYTNGRGLRREQDYLARAGYAVLHTDYRNHAQSDDDPRSELTLRLGYTEDVINAVMAIRRSSIRQLDGRRIGMLGRSMGGGITLNALVAVPDLVDAAVLYAPTSSNAVDNFNRWTRRRAVGDRILERYGAPSEAPDFWRNLSPVNYFERVQAPVLIHHGTRDESCPIRWSRETERALRREGKVVRLIEYEDEQHAFGPQWTRSMERTVNFLQRHLRA